MCVLFFVYVCYSLYPIIIPLYPMISTVTTTATTFFPHLFQQFIGRARQLLVLRAQQGAEVAQGEGVEEEHLPRWTRQRRVTPTAATGDT